MAFVKFVACVPNIKNLCQFYSADGLGPGTTNPVDSKVVHPTDVVSGEEGAPAKKGNPNDSTTEGDTHLVDDHEAPRDESLERLFAHTNAVVDAVSNKEWTKARKATWSFTCNLSTAVDASVLMKFIAEMLVACHSGSIGLCLVALLGIPSAIVSLKKILKRHRSRDEDDQ